MRAETAFGAICVVALLLGGCGRAPSAPNGGVLSTYAVAPSGDDTLAPTPFPVATPTPTPASTASEPPVAVAQAVVQQPATAAAPAAAPPAPIPIAAGALYPDCSGATPLDSRTTIYRDTCAPGAYLLAHNPGAGGAFFGYPIGTRLAYGGAVYTVRSVAYMSPAAAWSLAFSNPMPLSLQTCANASGSIVLVVKAS